MIELTIKNCNNIEEATISIVKKHLNIKYGINGTGKSTIANAITNNSGNLEELMPFKYREDNTENIKPTIEGADTLESVLVFNEEYINQFVFQEKELIENSFDIFIKDTKYIENQESIDILMKDIKDLFEDNKKLAQIISDLEELSGSFGKSKDGYAKSGKMAKGLGSGNKLKNIPEGLEDYREYIQNDNNVKWLKWQMDGSKSYLTIKEDKCPYCTAEVKEEKKEMITKVSKEYNATAINHLVQMLGVFERLDKYFSNDVKEQLILIIANSTGFSEGEIKYLVQVKEQIETLLNQLKNLEKLSFHFFKDINDLEEKINSLNINLGVIPFINSDETQEIINPMNESLETILKDIGKLKGKINIQKNKIKTTIETYQDDINSFLEMAGYRYHIVIEEENEEYKMKLKHLDYSSVVQNGSQHLSFGERNAFSLILFMYECLSNNPDLIILDDPISSFDKNKKYAIMYRLFRGEKSFKDKTVLMLTHDIEPIIDTIKIKRHIFQPLPKASFLQLKNNKIEEVEITNNDLLTFAQLCKINLLSDISDIAKTIYLRRYYEIMDDKGLEYQMLSSLQHGREVPTLQGDISDRHLVKLKQLTWTSNIIKLTLKDYQFQYRELCSKFMTKEENIKALRDIQEMMPSFKYSNILAVLKDKGKLKNLYTASSNSYEKLQLFRLLDITIPNEMVDKFVKETYHIENEQISQLNPLKYEIVPDFIIKECDKRL